MGWYICVPLEASQPREWREDPWKVAAALFSPGYIGGWSAVEHWGLTDQIFNVIYVIAGRKVKPARQTIQGTHYLIRTVPERTLFGTRRVWRQRVPVNVSDPHRTIIDILDVPKAAGGALHASEVLQTYFESEHADQTKLLQYGDRLGRGTVFKRLGYLAERARLANVDFVEACRSRITKGLSQLDPSGPPNGRIIARWNLRVNTLRLAPDEGDGS
jgi:predicted transcriptional regulator of viral defense system